MEKTVDKTICGVGVGKQPEPEFEYAQVWEADSW